MLSSKNASKDADKVTAEASTHTRRTKDGEEVLEDMVTVRTAGEGGGAGEGGERNGEEVRVGGGGEGQRMGERTWSREMGKERGTGSMSGKERGTGSMSGKERGTGSVSGKEGGRKKGKDKVTATTLLPICESWRPAAPTPLLISR